MRVLVIDQCSGSKDVPDRAPAFDIDAIDGPGLDALRDRDGVPVKPARNLYAGRQQRYIDGAVDALQEAGTNITRVFVSAGFGVIDDREPLPPYEVTFSDYDETAIRERADRLAIPADIRALLTATPSYDIVVFALGSEYYHAIDLPAALETLPESSIGVVFNQETVAEDYDNVVSIPARTAQAKEHETITVALKGVYLQHFAGHVANGAAVETIDDAERYCTTDPTTQTGLDAFE